LAESQNRAIVLGSAAIQTYVAVEARILGLLKEIDTMKTAKHTLVLMLFAGANAIAGTIFSDNFTETALGSPWQVLSGNGSYTVGGGHLTYYNKGPQSGPGGWQTTSESLVLPFAGTNWQLDIQATYSLDWLQPGYSYTGPVQANTANSSGAQDARAMVAFDPATESDRTSLGGTNVAWFSRVIDAWYGTDQFDAIYGGGGSSLQKPVDTWIVDNVVGGTYWLRFVRTGGTLVMSYSTNGTSYLPGMTSTLAEPSSSYNEFAISGLTFLTAGSHTDFSNLTIQSLNGSEAPEPGGLPLAASGLVAGALFLARRARHCAAAHRL
jgi:hypothetical protein